MKSKEYKCINCNASAEYEIKKSFLGFQKFKCKECEQENLYPLTKGYRITYWVVVIWFSLFSMASIIRGEIPLPGILVIGGIWGLIADFKIQKKLKQLKGTPNQSE